MEMMREFLYLNSRLVQQFLAQVEGGVFDETNEKTSQSGKGGLTAGVKTPVIEGRADKSRESSTENERTVRQTPESEFNRLYQHLQTDGLVEIDEIDETEYVSKLPRGTLLELFDINVHRSGFQEIGGIAKQAAGLLPLMDAFGMSSDVSDKTRTQIETAASLDDDSKPLGVIGSISGSANVQVGFDLIRASILEEVEGEVTALVKVSKVLKRGDSHMVGDVTGGLSSQLSREQRRKMMSGFKKGGPGGISLSKPEIHYPGFVATVVAIYR